MFKSHAGVSHCKLLILYLLTDDDGYVVQTAYIPMLSCIPNPFCSLFSRPQSPPALVPPTAPMSQNIF